MGEIVSIHTAQMKAVRQEPGDAMLRERVSALRERRAAWGHAIRQRRVNYGFSTRDLAQAIGLSTPTLISAVEAGRGRVPEGVLSGWAVALGMEPAEFAAGYLAAFEPDAFAALRHAREGQSREEGKPA